MTPKRFKEELSLPKMQLWVEMRTNEWVVGKLRQKPCLLQGIDRQKLLFVGHVIRNKGRDVILSGESFLESENVEGPK